MRHAILILILFAAVFSSCRKDRLLKDSGIRLQFSADTIYFDTVFTTIGSITERLKIYNPYKRPVEISDVWLKAGQSSNFKLNVDGVQGKSVRNVRIEAEDSIFVFIEVTVNPNGGFSPMVIEEQLMVECNGGVQHVDLVAWGQDAYFFASGRLKYDFPISLFTDKPNVFYGYTLIDTGTTLIIPCGASVHFHPNAGLIVGHEASLKILGCEDDPVILQGDRLEDFFRDVPGQWLQILLSATSRDNEIRNAIIKNGSIGVRVDSNTNANPTLIMENTQILNMSFIGLLGQTARIEAHNTVVANCGDHAVALAYGGNYLFRHCTFANYWSGNPRSKATLLLNNYFKVNNRVYARDLNATLENCIVHGNLKSELERDFSNDASHDYLFDHVILQLDTENINRPDRFVSITRNPANISGNDTISDPLFIDRAKGDYRLHALSRAIDQGKELPSNPFFDQSKDLRGKGRQGRPDLGAYEYVQ